MNLKAVKPTWVKDSFIAGEFLPTEKYELAYLEGLRIGVIGYKKEEFTEIVDWVYRRKKYSKEKGRLLRLMLKKSSPREAKSNLL